MAVLTTEGVVSPPPDACLDDEKHKYGLGGGVDFARNSPQRPRRELRLTWGVVCTTAASVAGGDARWMLVRSRGRVAERRCGGGVSLPTRICGEILSKQGTQNRARCTHHEVSNVSVAVGSSILLLGEQVSEAAAAVVVVVVVVETFGGAT